MSEAKPARVFGSLLSDGSQIMDAERVGPSDYGALLILLPVAAAGAFVALRALRRQDSRRQLARAAHDLSFGQTVGGGHSGLRGGFEVQITPAWLGFERGQMAELRTLALAPTLGELVQGLRVVVRLPKPAPTGWTFQQTLLGLDSVVGHEDAAVALLDGQIRSALPKAAGVALEPEQVVVQLLTLHLSALDACVNAAVALAAKVSRPGATLEGYLVHHARHDCSPQVRGACTEALLRLAPGSAEAEQAAADALCDFEPEVRLTVARLVGGQGFEALAQLVSSEVAKPSTRKQALLHAAGVMPRAQVLSLLLAGVQSGDSDLCYAALDLLERNRMSQALPALATLDLKRLTPEVQARLAAVLATLGAGTAEPALLRMLSAPYEVVQIAAADGLARVGGPAALAPLHSAFKRGRGRSQLRFALQTALSLVRARGDPEAHGLSLTDTARNGRLSVEVDSGSVSVAVEPVP